MDKALDEIITTTKRTRRPGSGPRRGSAKAQVLGKPAPNPVARARMAVAATPAPGTHVAEKIVVSNLPQDVNEGHVRELFSKTIGPCKEVNLFYDANGRSKGSAAIRFARKGDALKAHALYDGKLIDNRLPMKIEIIVDPAAAPAASLVSRVTPRVAPAANGAPAGARGSTRGRGRGGRGGGGGRRTKTERPQKSAEDLDAEMEDYTAASNAPAAAATAAA